MVSVVSLWGENQVFSKCWVAEEKFDTLNDVAAMKLQLLPCYREFIAVKRRGTRQCVDDLVQLTAITVQ